MFSILIRICILWLSSAFVTILISNKNAPLGLGCQSIQDFYMQCTVKIVRVLQRLQAKFYINSSDLVSRRRCVSLKCANPKNDPDVSIKKF